MVEYIKTSLGGTLRESRMISGFTLNEAAEAAGIPLTHLLDIENEGCGPTKDILRRLMRAYGPAIRSLHQVPGQERRIEAAHAKSEIDWIQLMLQSEEASNKELLAEVAVAVRALRGLSSNLPVHMRTPEADLLVSMLDLNDKDLAVDIMTEFSLSVVQTRDFITGAVNRARQRAGGTDSEFVRRLSEVEVSETEEPIAS